MKKFLSTLLISLSIAGSLTGCSTEKNTANEVNTFSSIEGDMISTIVEEADTLSNELFSYQITLGDDIIQLPMSVSDMESLGWTKGDAWDENIEPNYGTLIDWEKGDYKIITTAFNLTEETIPADEGLICHLSVSTTLNPDPSVTKVFLPNGIQLGVSTQDDVIKAYGNPSRGENVLTYEPSKFASQNIQLSFNSDTDILSSIDITNNTFIE